MAKDIIPTGKGRRVRKEDRSQGQRAFQVGRCCPRVVCFKGEDKSAQKISLNLDYSGVYSMSLKKNAFDSSQCQAVSSQSFSN